MYFLYILPTYPRKVYPRNVIGKTNHVQSDWYKSAGNSMRKIYENTNLFISS